MCRQRGAIVLTAITFLLLLVVAAGAYRVTSREVVNLARDSLGSDLAFARESLIEYSVNYASHYADTGAGPGHLPCPDDSGNGSPALSCSGSPVGLLPVDFETSTGKNISFQVRQAQTEEPIWYVLSSAFRYSPVSSGAVDAATIVNSDTRGNLTLDDDDEVIALLIAPGPVLQGQSRHGALSIDDYLEGENSDGDLVFSTGVGNDRILAIRWEDLMPLVERRVMALVRDVMEDYQRENGYLPWLSPVGEPLLQGDSACVVCQRTGWIASERYYNNSAWPPFSEQSCKRDQGTISQPTPDLPVWFVRNFWHRNIWLHLRSSERDQGCGTIVEPTFDGKEVDAVVVSVGRELAQPRHGEGEQRRGGADGVADYLDQADWLDTDGQYHSIEPGFDTNDQWSVLP